MLGDFIRERLFELEWCSSETKLDVAPFREYYTNRGARVAEGIPLAAGLDCVSVSFRESQQLLVHQLPIGARTLLLSSESVLLRGVNKFSEAPVDCHGSIGQALEHQFPVVVQRKLAGFVLHVMSLDGMHLEFVTKHSTTGPHATWARDIWRSVVSAEESKLATALAEAKLVLCCECIDLIHDTGHPIPEPRDYGDRRLLCFSVQLRESLQELALPNEAACALCRSWGVPFVASRQLKSTNEFEAVVNEMCAWNGMLLGEAVCEGAVVTIELPPRFVRACFLEGAEKTLELAEGFVSPLRLKVKAEKYKIVRSLRSRALNESSSIGSRNAFAIHPFHELFVTWCAHVLRWTAKELEENVRERGIADLIAEFERYCQRKRQRPDGDAAPTGQPKRSFHDLVRWSTEIAIHRALPSQCSKHVLLLLCGLPGSGKSTATKLISERIVATGLFGWVFILSRDAVAQTLAKTDAECESKHAQRRLRGTIHYKLLDQVGRVSAALSWSRETCLVVLDACHAEERTRDYWMSQFPSNVTKLVAYFHCETAAARAAARSEHEILLGEEAVERATFAVGRRFTPPAGDRVISLNTSILDATGTCDQLYRRLGVLDRTVPERPCEVVEAAELDDKFFSPQLSQFTQDILGVQPERNFWPFAKSKVTLQNSYGIACIVPAENSNWDELRTAATAALVDVLEPSATSASLVSRLKQALFRVKHEASVQWGHTRWLHGLVKSRRYHAKGDAATMLCSSILEGEIRDRFEMRNELHVTMHFATGRTSAQTCRDWLAAHSLHEGDLVSVVVTSVCMSLDSFVCRVEQLSLPPACDKLVLASTNSFDDVEYPLHVTVGCSPGTDALEGAVLMDAVEELHKDNLRCQEEKARRKSANKLLPALPSRETKMHNFVEVRFANPLKLSGQIALR